MSDSTDINADDYESDEVNAIYFTAVFVVLIVWSRLMNYQADIGVIAGLIGVSGAYLFMFKAVQVLAKSLLKIDIEQSSLTLRDSIVKELLLSAAFLFMATFTLFAWGSTSTPIPTIVNMLNFVIAYVAGIFIKFAMIKFTHVPIVGVILAGIFLILLGFVFNASLLG